MKSFGILKNEIDVTRLQAVYSIQHKWRLSCGRFDNIALSENLNRCDKDVQTLIKKNKVIKILIC